MRRKEEKTREKKRYYYKKKKTHACAQTHIKKQARTQTDKETLRNA